MRKVITVKSVFLVSVLLLILSIALLFILPSSIAYECSSSGFILFEHQDSNPLKDIRATNNCSLEPNTLGHMAEVIIPITISLVLALGAVLIKRKIASSKATGRGK